MQQSPAGNWQVTSVQPFALCLGREGCQLWRPAQPSLVGVGALVQVGERAGSCVVAVVTPGE